MNDRENDILEFETDDGEQLRLTVLDDLFYEGRQYVILTDAADEDEAEEAEDVGIYVMEVRPVDEEEEEFVPVDDDLGQKILEVYQTSEVWEDEDEEYEDET